jgi:hypothetical protein
MGVPASGKRFSVEGTTFLQIAEGKVAQFWGFLDQMGLMQQIGGPPTPGPAGRPSVSTPAAIVRPDARPALEAGDPGGR